MPDDESGDIKLTNPEGANFDDKHIEGVTAFAKENKLTQEQAQGILVKQHEAVSAHVEANKPQIPEKYNLKAPEGSLLDAAAVEKIATYSKERGFTQEQAEAQLKRESEVHTSYMEGQKEALEKAAEGWIEEAKNDPEIGGDNFAKNSEIGKRFVDHFGSPKLKDALNESGLGNHPEFIRMILGASKELGIEDDKWVPGKPATTPERKSTADVLYPSTSAA